MVFIPGPKLGIMKYFINPIEDYHNLQLAKEKISFVLLSNKSERLYDDEDDTQLGIEISA